MKLLTCRLLVFVLTLILSNFGFAAGISVEPYVGGAAFYKNSSFNYSFPYLGLRLGYSRWGLTMGLEASYMQYSPATQSVSTEFIDDGSFSAESGFSQLYSKNATVRNDSFSYHVYQVGPSIGFELPLIIDAYASLVWVQGSISEVEGSLSGAGLKVGASYLSLPFLSLNLEFQAINYFECLSFEGSKDIPCKDNKKIGNKSLDGLVYIAAITLSSPISTGWLAPN